MAALSELNDWPAEKAEAELRRCCACAAWARRVASRRPFADEAALLGAAQEEWDRSTSADWLEAFRGHPRIGDRKALKAKFAATRAWASGEQSGVDRAGEDVLDALAAGNQDYEAKFGHIFIVCATGKSAPEMLALLRERLKNDPETERAVAAAEQAKITRLRLQKLLEDA